jgi:hypothetical protein
MTTINYRKADVDGLKVFYREAGRVDAPALLLLHGFPSASHMFPIYCRFWPIASTSSRLTCGLRPSDMPARRSASRCTFLTTAPSSFRIAATSGAHHSDHLAEWQRL